MTTGDVVYSLRFFTHQSADPEPGFELNSTAGESSMLTTRLHMLYCILYSNQTPSILNCKHIEAFDTIDHGILLSRLNSLYDISGDALDWFKSYLSNRVQRVIIGDTISECKELNFEVPQGSVLGLKIYCMYTKPISDIIGGHGLSYHSYADDTQLYIAIEHSANLHSELLRMERCVADIRNWMRHNMLKLNDDKTELIVFASRYNQHLYSGQHDDWQYNGCLRASS